VTEQQYVIGVDLGGTHARVGVLTPGGSQVAVAEQALPEKRTPRTAVEVTSALIKKLMQGNHLTAILGIGAGVTGPVIPSQGTMISPHTDPPWQFVPYSAPLAEEFAVPVVLENDADAAALGEYWQGAGRGVERLYVVTVGTGIGTAYIVNGEIFRGRGDWHPEGGHQIIDPASGSTCYCKETGCWEALASGDGFTAQCRKRAVEEPVWLTRLGLTAAEQLTSSLVVQAARKGDRVAHELVEKEAYYLGVGLLNIISFFVPDKIVLSGGLMKHFDLFEPGIRSVINRHEVLVPASEVIIEPDSLDYHAGVYGAAYALLRSLGIA
jgi:glucokinase